MKKIKIYTVIVGILFGGFLYQSCTADFEEMNTDPFNPTKASIPTVMNSVLSTFFLGWQEMQAVHNGYYYVVTEQLANAGPRYVLEQGVNDTWNNYYNSLRTIRYLEKELGKSTLKVDNIASMLDVCVAYKTLRTADYFGDMPFTKAGYAADGKEFNFVAYDKHEDIYKTCLDMLKKSADSFIDGSDEQVESAGDAYNIFWKESFVSGKSYLMWRKFANSIRLRYAIQLANVDPATANAHISEILGNPTKYPLLDGDGRDETAGMWIKKLGYTLESRSWSFSAENLTCMGTVMWNEMSSIPAPQIGTTAEESDGVADPQFYDPRGYLFFETNRWNKWIPQQQIGATITQPPGAYSNGSYPNGRYHAQTAQEWNNKKEAYYSSVNYYLTRDETAYPEVMISEAEVHFLKAEAYQRGLGVGKDIAKAKASYEAGIRASMETWFSFYTLINESTYKWVMYPPAVPSASDVTAYIGKNGIAYNGADDGVALKQIYKQMWIDSFRQPWVAFNLYRRGATIPHQDGLATEFANFYRLPYPPSEITYNSQNYQAALGGRENTPQSKKLFWQK